jgi:protein O-mannosyl-transferase
MSNNTPPSKKQKNINYNQKPVSPQLQVNHSLKLPLFIAFCVPVLLYLQTVSFGFVCFDDDKLLVNNGRFFSHFSNVIHAFSTDALTTKQSLFYRPMQTISYLVDALISGADKAWMFHFSNVLLIGFIAGALFAFLKQFQIPQIMALLSSILYCVHPLFVSSIAWIPARGDLQLTLFSLLALVLLIEYHRKGKMMNLFLHYVSFIIALYCKETAVMLPVVFALYLFCFTDKLLFAYKQVVHYSIYGVIGIAWFWMRSQAIVDSAQQENHVGISSAFPMLKTIPESLTTFLFPFGIAPIPNFSLVKTIAGLIIIAFIIFIFILSKTSSTKKNLFFLGWFLLFMAPTLFFKNILIDYLDHRFLLPLIGILLFAVTALPHHWIEQLQNKKAWIVIVLIASLAFNTFIKTKAYANPTTFYNEALDKNSESCLIYYNRGCYKINQSGTLGQIEEYSKAIALRPDYYSAYVNRGSAYAEVKMHEKALADYSKAMDIKPNYAEAYYNRGYTYRQMQINDKALADFSKAISLKPAYYPAIINRAHTYVFFKQFDQALADYGTAIELRPNSIDAYYFRGIIYEQMKENDNAIAAYTKAISIDPSKVELFFNRGNVFNSKGMYDKAIQDYSTAIELNPKRGNAFNNRGIAFYNKGMKDRACHDLKNAEILGVQTAHATWIRLCR